MNKICAAIRVKNVWIAIGIRTTRVLNLLAENSEH